MRWIVYSGVWLLAAVAVGENAASAQNFYEFEYPETEKIYNTTIKDLMAKECYAARQLMKSKADSLGMEVRKVDITKLQQLLRNKSFLYAACFDKAIRAKSDDPKISLEKHSLNCSKEGLKIMDVLSRGNLKEWGIPELSSMDEVPYTTCTLFAGKIYGVRTFDFLIDEDELPSLNKDKLHLYTVNATDFFAVKKCVLEKVRSRF